MGTLFDTVIQKIFTFLSNLWTQIFGGWNYQTLFFWLPNDIMAAVNIVIVILFGLAMWKLFMQVIPH